MLIRNFHSRVLPVDATVAGALLDNLAGPDDGLWPADHWPPLRFDRPLCVGATGGHGPIRYTVVGYEPGRRLRCRFDESAGVEGIHEFAVTTLGPDRCELTHLIAARSSGIGLLRWLVAIRWLHDAVIEELLDNAERACTGTVHSPTHWSPYVRLWRRIKFPSNSPKPEVRVRSHP